MVIILIDATVKLKRAHAHGKMLGRARKLAQATLGVWDIVIRNLARLAAIYILLILLAPLVHLIGFTNQEKLQTALIS